MLLRGENQEKIDKSGAYQNLSATEDVVGSNAGLTTGGTFAPHKAFSSERNVR